MIDANVLVAAAVTPHEHHESSASLINGSPPHSYATPRHCLAEFYSVATRVTVKGIDPLPPAGAVRAIETYASQIDTLDIGADLQLEATRQFSAMGGVGPRIYDFLIGHVALVNAIPLIVTWNVKHFAPLFPALRVATPASLLEES